jgi:CrcB protein
VNVLGSFAIGVVATWCLKRGAPASTTAILVTGFLGGFTTYSAFNYELTMFLADGQTGRAGIYALVMLLTCLVAGWAGLLPAR